MSETDHEESRGKLRILNFLPLLAVAAAAAIFAYQQELVPDIRVKQSSYPDDTLPRPQRVDFESPITGSLYEVYIQRPHGYDESDKRYPVFYALSGRAAISNHRKMVLPLLREGNIPEAIFVGIDHKQMLSSPMFARFSNVVNSPRVRDYTFVKEENKLHETGGAPEFLAFLRDNIIPYIDGVYRTIPEDRGFGGYGLEGFFVMYTAFTEPELFQRYLALSPPLDRNDFAVLGLEENLAKQNRSFPISLYLSVGEMDSPGALRGWQSMTDTLLARDYLGFRFRHEMYTQTEEVNGFLESVHNGLTFVYETGS